LVSEVARPAAVTTSDVPGPSRVDGPRSDQDDDIQGKSSRRRQTGELVVRCDPWCVIWIDGVKKGTSPRVFALPVGARRVRLVNPDLQQEASRNVIVTAEKQQVVEETW
jgi:hypothetical protein